jgi:hypothetical protein
VAHVGEECRLGATRRLGLVLGGLKLAVSLLQFSDVGVDGDGAAVRRLALADADPAALVVELDKAVRIGVALQALAQPFLPVAIKPGDEA